MTIVNYDVTSLVIRVKWPGDIIYCITWWGCLLDMGFFNWGFCKDYFSDYSKMLWFTCDQPCFGIT